MEKSESASGKTPEPVVRKPLNNKEFVEAMRIVRFELDRRSMKLRTPAEFLEPSPAPADNPCPELFLLQEATQRAIVANDCQPL